MAIPRTRYAKTGDVSLAYQVVGEGPADLVYLPPALCNQVKASHSAVDLGKWTQGDSNPRPRGCQVSKG